MEVIKMHVRKCSENQSLVAVDLIKEGSLTQTGFCLIDCYQINFCFKLHRVYSVYYYYFFLERLN